jgi:hypothetical protein
MTEYIIQDIGWFSLTPAPLNHATIKSVVAIDCKSTFCYDGTNCAIFVWAELKWYGPYAFSFSGLIENIWCSQIINGYFQVINAGYPGQTYLFNKNSGLIKTLLSFNGNSGGSIISSDFHGYLGSDYFFPCPEVDSVNVFYLETYPEYIFYTCIDSYGPNTYITIATYVITGQPLFQIKDNTFCNTGNIARGVIPSQILLSDNQFTFSINVSDMLEYSPVNDQATLIVHPQSSNVDALGFFAPAITPLNNEDVYNYDGFIYSLTQLFVSGQSGALTPNFLYLLNSTGTEITWTPFTFTKNDLSQGYFGLGITLPTPEPIPLNQEQQYVGNSARYSTHIFSGNIFGYFAADFSSGYYLGVAQASFQSYIVNNYTRYDG